MRVVVATALCVHALLRRRLDAVQEPIPAVADTAEEDAHLSALRAENARLKRHKEELAKELQEEELAEENAALRRETEELAAAVAAKAAAEKAEAHGPSAAELPAFPKRTWGSERRAPAEPSATSGEPPVAEPRPLSAASRTLLDHLAPAELARIRARVSRDVAWVRYEQNATRRAPPVLELAKVLRLAVGELVANRSAAHSPAPAAPRKAPRAGCTKPKARPAFLQLHMDPTCREGIIDAEMRFCCAADCGECDDRSNICKHKITNGRGSTCCPSDMRRDPMLPSCDFSLSPCEVPERIRAAPAVEDLTTAEGARTAIDDCGDAVRATDIKQLIHTHFIEFVDKTVKSTGEGLPAKTSEGEYGTVEAAAAACNRMDTCLGFVTTGSTAERADEAGTPSHLLLAGSVLETLEVSASETTYLKVEDLAGNKFAITPGFWGECNATCGGGVTTRTLACRGTAAGTDVPLGLCSAQVGLSADATPATSGTCNVFECEYPANGTNGTNDTLMDASSSFVSTDAVLTALAAVAPQEVLDDVETMTRIEPDAEETAADGDACDLPDGAEWYVAEDGPVAKPCTVGLQTEGLYLVGEWGSGTATGPADFGSGLPFWDQRELQYVPSTGRAVHGPEDCWRARVPQAVAVAYVPLLFARDRRACDATSLPTAEAENIPVGMCQYLVGAPLPPVLFRGDATAQDLVTAQLLTPTGPADGYSCSKGKLWVAKNPLVYGFGWDVVGYAGWVQEVNGRASSPHGDWWQARLAKNGGKWPSPDWWKANRSAEGA